MPAIRLVDMACKHSTNIWRCATVTTSLLLHIVPCMRRQLTNLSLIIIRVEIEVAGLGHNVDASLSGVLFGFKINAGRKCVDLLSLQIDLLADKIGVSGGIG